MNREIKYRGKVKMPEKRNFARQEYVPEGQWVYGEPHTIDCPTPHIHTVDVGKQPIDEDTIGQFTGFIDTNKKPIYEGDIVDTGYILYDPWDGAAEIIEPMRCVVVYEDYAFRFKKGENLSYLIHDVTNLKVVGNIHDNPELMEGDK